MQTSAMTSPSKLPDAPALSEKRTDVWISYFGPDLLFARRFAGALHDLGYRIAPYGVLNFANTTREKLTPNDARCVIVVWTPDALDAQQLQGDARTAGVRGALIEVGIRGACPVERFSDEALISFDRLDKTPQGAHWRDLLARVQACCGPPPNRQSDIMANAQIALAVVLTLAGAGAGAKMIEGMAQNRRETIARSFTQPAQPELPGEILAGAKRPSLTPTTDMNVRVGGPDDYIAQDLGTAPPVPVAPVVATNADAAAAGGERNVQGPEE